jgi:SagB-type dehydrogenase family enzyme
MSKWKEKRKFLKATGWHQLGKPGHETDQQKKLPVPSVRKEYSPGAKLIDLTPIEKLSLGEMALVDVITRRRSRRKFTRDALSLDELSFLLWATQGVRQVNAQAGVVYSSYRTVPSGGARHALETYLAVERVDGLECGLYRYLPFEHKLVCLRQESSLAARVAKACCEQTWMDQAAVTFIWTTIPYRAEWRYSTEAAKGIAQDSGHLCQNLYLASEAIGAGTCAIGAYYQEAMDAIVEVDGTDEFVVYVAPVGRIDPKE